MFNQLKKCVLKKISIIIFTLMIISLCCIGNVSAMAGSGTQEDPYQITNAEELQSMKDNLSAYFVLNNDIDCSSLTNWTPIGNESSPFIGHLNGKGKTIKNLTFSTTSGYSGIFGVISNSVTIENCTLDNIKINTSEVRSGLLTGGIGNTISSSKINEITIKNSKLTSSYSMSGGFAGTVKGGSKIEFSKCNIINSIISCSERGGGFIGNVFSGANVIFSQCKSEKNAIKITNLNSSGGFVGNTYQANLFIDGNCSVEDCYIYANGGASASFVGSDEDISYISIVDSYSKRNVIYGGSSEDSGGIIGAIVEGTVEAIEVEVDGCTICSMKNASGICPNPESDLIIENCSIKNTTILANNSSSSAYGFSSTLESDMIMDSTIINSNVCGLGHSYNVCAGGDGSTEVINVTNISAAFVKANTTGTSSYDENLNKINFQIYQDNSLTIKGFIGSIVKFDDSKLINTCSITHTKDSKVYTDDVSINEEGEITVNWAGREGGIYNSVLTLNNNFGNIQISFTTTVNVFEGGNGTSSDPYQIKNVKQLQMMEQYLNNTYFILIDNIDCSTATTWRPIGNDTTPFNGHLNGNNKTIENLTATFDIENSGIFGVTNSTMTFYNCTLKNINFTSTKNNLGGICGKIKSGNNLSFTNIKLINSKFISNNNNVSAFVGLINDDSDVIFEECACESNVISSDMCSSGFVSEIDDSFVIIRTSIVNKCTIKSNSEYSGGFIGKLYASYINILAYSECKNSVIISKNNNVGGCIGLSEDTELIISLTTIHNCSIFSTEGQNVGGVIGQKINSRPFFDYINVEQCTLQSLGIVYGLSNREGNDFPSEIIISNTTISSLYGKAYGISDSDEANIFDECSIKYSNVYGNQGSYNVCAGGNGTVIVDKVTNYENDVIIAKSTGNATFDKNNKNVNFSIYINDAETSITGYEGSTVKESTNGVISGIYWSHTNGTDTYTDTTELTNGICTINWDGRNGGSYTSTLTLINDIGSCIVTFSFIAPPYSNASIQAVKGPLNTSVSLESVNETIGTKSIQWQTSLNQTNWDDISGATENNYTAIINDTSNTDHYYRIKLTDSSSGIIYSNVVKYQSLVSTPSTLTTDSTSGGLLASINLELTDTTSSMYQWQSSIDGINYVNISGETTLKTKSIAIADVESTIHYYRVLCINTSGNTFSNIVTYTSYAPIIINNVSITPTIGTTDTTFTLTSNATGGRDTLTYTWYKSTDGTNWGTSIGTGAIYRGKISPNGTYLFKVIVSDGTNSKDSYSDYTTFKSITATVTNELSIDSITVSPTTGDRTTNFTMKATSSGGISPHTYTWYKSTDAVNWGTPIGTGATINKTITEDGIYYLKCIISDTITTKDSYSDYETFKNITVTIDNKPLINDVTISPSSGDMVNVISLSANVQKATSMQWKMTKPNGTTIDLDGGTTSTFIYRFSETIEGIYLFKLHAINEYGYKDSDAVSYTASTIVLPIINSVEVTPNRATEPQTITLKSNVNERGLLTTYQWYIKLPNETSYEPISGATIPTFLYAFPYIEKGDYYFKLLASNENGQVESYSVKFTLGKTFINGVSTNSQSAFLVAIIAPLCMLGGLLFLIVRGRATPAILIGGIGAMLATFLLVYILISVTGIFDGMTFDQWFR